MPPRVLALRAKTPSGFGSLGQNPAGAISCPHLESAEELSACITDFLTKLQSLSD